MLDWVSWVFIIVFGSLFISVAATDGKSLKWIEEFIASLCMTMFKTWSRALFTAMMICCLILVAIIAGFFSHFVVAGNIDNFFESKYICNESKVEYNYYLPENKYGMQLLNVFNLGADATFYCDGKINKYRFEVDKVESVAQIKEGIPSTEEVEVISVGTFKIQS